LVLKNTTAYCAKAWLTSKKVLYDFFPGVKLSKQFWRIITHTFCKLDHFINVSNICCIAMKRCSLQNRASKLTPKSFMRSTPALNGKTTVVCESFNTVKFLEKTQNNGPACLKNVNNCLNTNTYSYLRHFAVKVQIYI
jgi:hypothetical protein